MLCSLRIVGIIFCNAPSTTDMTKMLNVLRSLVHKLFGGVVSLVIGRMLWCSYMGEFDPRLC